ncbi:MAG TPA: 1-deoxy-D-xylulose-5-phosphate synthase [Candidatus Saccharimonadales bacterium]|nr:1-deoxy-D-xylulose-5-phosphate synthase [Candidatus Saccharimonadales bacterium]
MTRLLDSIHGPEDLKLLTLEQLEQLAQEIRDEILRVVSETGGHLGPSLGVVELTLALHRVFESPTDQIVWDVGHQAYCHKLLTGRRERFHTLRQYGGLSGFTRRAESPHDVFGAGHGGTSISVAAGLATARDLAGRDNHVIAVIGDGSLTAGMAYEALNHAGGTGRRLLVVLNDNEMSISRNVGALAAYLTRMTSSHGYRRVEADIYDLLGKVPMASKARELARRVKEGLKGLMVPGVLFEELGFKYYGPIDGHDLKLLEETLVHLKDFREPVLLHVLTKKGKGVGFAEAAPVKFHGLGPFDKVTGKTQPSATATFSQEFARILIEIAEREPRVVAITAAMLEGTGLRAFQERFPDRCFDVGMAEQHAVGLAGGLAVGGFRPVCAIYSTFLQRAYDQVVHDIALQNLPVVFAADRAGFAGDDGPTHHGAFDLGYLRCIPNLTLMAPCDEQEFADMLYAAVTQATGPVEVRYPRANVPGAGRQGFRPLSWGTAEVRREGRDLAIWALGAAVPWALEAAELMRAEGPDATVVNARFAKPLDEELLVRHARRFGRLVTVEEGAAAGGFGSAVLEALERNDLPGVEVRRIGIPDEFVQHGRRELLLRDVGLTPELIARRIRERWRAYVTK